MHERYGSELGFQLMKIESDILIAVITHLFKNGSKKSPGDQRNISLLLG